MSSAVALAVMDVIKEERPLEDAAEQGNYIMKRLENLKEECEIIGDVRGEGLMIGVEIVEDKDRKKTAREKSEGKHDKVLEARNRYNNLWGINILDSAPTHHDRRIH